MWRAMRRDVRVVATGDGRSHPPARSPPRSTSRRTPPLDALPAKGGSEGWNAWGRGPRWYGVPSVARRWANCDPTPPQPTMTAHDGYLRKPPRRPIPSRRRGPSPLTSNRASARGSFREGARRRGGARRRARRRRGGPRRRLSACELGAGGRRRWDRQRRALPSAVRPRPRLSPRRDRRRATQARPRASSAGP